MLVPTPSSDLTPVVVPPAPVGGPVIASPPVAGTETVVAPPAPAVLGQGIGASEARDIAQEEADASMDWRTTDW
ncbi:MAG: hypothetical protein AAF170_04345 [Bacteroidota bacterium]